MTRRRGIAAGLVVLVGAVVVLAMTSPWSSESVQGDQPQAAREVDPLELSRKLVGGKARFTDCEDRGRRRVCEVEG